MKLTTDLTSVLPERTIDIDIDLMGESMAADLGLDTGEFIERVGYLPWDNSTMLQYKKEFNEALSMRKLNKSLASVGAMELAASILKEYYNSDADIMVLHTKCAVGRNGCMTRTMLSSVVNAFGICNMVETVMYWRELEFASFNDNERVQYDIIFTSEDAYNSFVEAIPQYLDKMSPSDRFQIIAAINSSSLDYILEKELTPDEYIEMATEYVNDCKRTKIKSLKAFKKKIYYYTGDTEYQLTYSADDYKTSFGGLTMPSLYQMSKFLRRYVHVGGTGRQIHDMCGKLIRLCEDNAYALVSLKKNNNTDE